MTSFQAIVQWVTILLPVLFVLILFVVMKLDVKYNEVARPLIGKLLFKKPMLHRDLYWSDVFRAGLNGRRPVTRQDMNRAQDAWAHAIFARSWYVRHDISWLNTYYREGWKWIVWSEQQELLRKAGAKAKSAPPPPPKSTSSWRTVLGLSSSERDVKVIKMAYRKQVMVDHPDRGGSGKKIPILTRAIDEARKELNFV